MSKNMEALSLITFGFFLMSYSGLAFARHIDDGGLVAVPVRHGEKYRSAGTADQGSHREHHDKQYIIYGVPNKTLIVVLLCIALVTIVVPLCMICCILRKRRDRWEGERAHLIYKALEAEGSYDDRSSFETLGPETPTQTAILEIARRDIEERPPLPGIPALSKAFNRPRTGSVATTSRGV